MAARICSGCSGMSNSLRGSAPMVRSPPRHPGWYNPQVERYLENRVAIVTGGAGGIGSELVKGMVAAGAPPVVNDHGGAIDGRDPSPGPAATLGEGIEAARGRAPAPTGAGGDHEGAPAPAAPAGEGHR